MNLTQLPSGPQPPQVVYAVIEIPRGGRNKYEYDATLELFRLDRVLYSAVHYPAAYGFIPSTQAADGDRGLLADDAARKGHAADQGVDSGPDH